MVVFTLRQVTEICDGAKYKVTNTVTEAQNASSAVYVYNTASQVFSHYATAVDMERWPDSHELAVLRSAVYYRQPSVTRTWESVRRMNEDLAMSLQRLQYLADELNAKQGALVIDRTTVIQGA